MKKCDKKTLASEPMFEDTIMTSSSRYRYLADCTGHNFAHFLEDEVDQPQAGLFQPVNLFFGHHVERKIGREEAEPHTCRGCIQKAGHINAYLYRTLLRAAHSRREQPGGRDYREASGTLFF